MSTKRQREKRRQYARSEVNPKTTIKSLSKVYRQRMADFLKDQYVPVLREPLSIAELQKTLPV